MTRFLVVVHRAADWPLALPVGGELVTARRYLTDEAYSQLRGVRVFNLCRSYRYQSLGWYVSLLAQARGHAVMPELGPVRDVLSPALVRSSLEDDLDPVLQQALKPLKTDTFELSIYFGRNLAKRYDRLCRRLFARYPLPLMRASLARVAGAWTIQRLRVIAAQDIPKDHRAFAAEAAERFFTGPRPRRGKPTNYRYDLAILVDPHEPEAPSDEPAIEAFQAAARRLGIRPEIIGPDDLVDLPAYDALFIRATTNVNHYTYRFAARAAAEGLVVIDDPQSILRCTNKVYLHELLTRHRVPTPRTMIAHGGNGDAVASTLGFPVVLKAPDSGFSQGVTKVEDPTALRRELKRLLASSELVIAQAWTPTDFDWRVGIINREPIFVCRYHMVAGHWQIIAHDESGGKVDEGYADGVPVTEAPAGVVKTALRAANLIGDGLYGVDVKQVGRRAIVIEVNDNPNVERGVEDAVLGTALYDRIMRSFLDRISARKQGHVAAP